jgi:hypothetical protein
VEKLRVTNAKKPFPWARVLNDKGLTFVDLMIGMSVLMIGISLLSIGLGVSRKSTLGTREAQYMGSLAGDVAERIMARPQEIEDIMVWANERNDPNRSVGYRVKVETRKNSATSEGSIEVYSYTFDGVEVVAEDERVSGKLETELKKVNVVVTYEAVEAGDEHEDDQKYELSFYVDD